MDSRCPENGRRLPEEPVFPCRSVSERPLDAGLSLVDAIALSPVTRFVYQAPCTDPINVSTPSQKSKAGVFIHAVAGVHYPW